MEPFEEPSDIAGVERWVTELEPFEETGDIIGVREVKRRKIKTRPENVAEVEIREGAGDASPGTNLGIITRKSIII